MSSISTSSDHPFGIYKLHRDEGAGSACVDTRACMAAQVSVYFVNMTLVYLGTEGEGREPWNWAAMKRMSLLTRISAAKLRGHDTLPRLYYDIIDRATWGTEFRRHWQDMHLSTTTREEKLGRLILTHLFFIGLGMMARPAWRTPPQKLD